MSVRSGIKEQQTTGGDGAIHDRKEGSGRCCRRGRLQTQHSDEDGGRLQRYVHHSNREVGAESDLSISFDLMII